MASSKDFEIAIIGGGIAGMTLAIALLKRNIKVKIYEQAHKFGEIGAGVAFGPNAVRAMQICDRAIEAAFDRTVTHNQWPSKRRVWFDFLDGTSTVTAGDGDSGYQDALFSVPCSQGSNGVHRAHYLAELLKLFPESLTALGHHLDNVSESKDTGRLLLHFHNGDLAEADAVIGCDGIKSRVRQLIVGEDHPSAHPGYSHKYAYRGLIPMEKAIEAVGEERALNSCFYVRTKLWVIASQAFF